VMMARRKRQFIGFGFDPGESAHHFAVIFPERTEDPVTIEVRFEWSDELDAVTDAARPSLVKVRLVPGGDAREEVGDNKMVRDRWILARNTIIDISRWVFIVYRVAESVQYEFHSLGVFGQNDKGMPMGLYDGFEDAF